MRKVVFVLIGCSLVAACYGGDPARVLAEVPDAAPVPEADAGVPPDVVPDAALYTPGVDSATSEPEPEDPPPLKDAGVRQPKDSGVDAALPDAGTLPCVTSIKVPTATTSVWVRYEGGVSVPYYCPAGTVDFNSCRYALGNPASGTVTPTTCRVAVPAKCLPCTNGVTEW